MSSTNEIAILDFGSQYTHLIARRIRELGVKSHIYPNDIPADRLKNAVGIILSGGPKSIVKDAKLAYDPKLFDLNVPILGLCYGHQLIADHFGGKVESSQSREYGLANLSLITRHLSPIFKNIPNQTSVWMSHGDHVAKMPENFLQIADSGNDSIAAMADEKRKIYGFQFHPEVHHTEFGMTMLTNFVFDICEAEKNWTTETMLQEIQAQIKKEAGDKNIFLLISGGVDSTVCFALLEKTLGKNRVYGLHVDHGLMRLNESTLVKKSLEVIGLDDLHVYNAEDEMLARLKEVYDPEEKRKIIGEFFVEIVERVWGCHSERSEAEPRNPFLADIDSLAKRKDKKSLRCIKKGSLDSPPGLTRDDVVNEWLLGQGTIYPDTIESGGTKNADKIKTHHNRVDKIQEMIAKGLIIEPIKELYKDEVREIGLKIGLPEALVNRHPFPGPGLAVRCLCAKGSNETSAVIAPPTRGGWPEGPEGVQIYRLPIKSVGVQGDERSYAHPALLVLPPRRGETERGLNLDWHELRKISPQITNTHKDLNRVLIPLSGDLEKIKNSTLKKGYVNKERLDLLRKIDAIVNQAINTPKCAHIWQFPVVLVPFGFNKQESIVLRPVESKEAMTVSFAELPDDILNKIKEEIESLDAVDFIFYDITNKPPGTIEWE
jgi:GMP synthase (glutamine-hydrolysing)